MACEIRVAHDFASVTSGAASVLPENTVPVAVIAPIPEFPPVGEPITFDGSGSSDAEGDIVSYEWDFGDGATAVGPVVTHTYSVEGNFTVRLTVRDELGAVGSTTLNVGANQPPVVSAVALPALAAIGETVVFDASDSFDPDGTINEIRWSFPDGGTLVGAIVGRSFAASGEQNVTVTVTDDRGATASSVVTVNVFAASASLLAYEGFDYPGGSALDGLGGGSGWAAAWSANNTFSAAVSGGDSRPGLESAGGRARIRGTTDRSLATPFASSSGTVWVGVFIRSSNSARTATFSLLESGVARLSVTHQPGAPVRLNGVDTGIESTGASRFALVRIDFAPSGNTAYVWVDPDLSSTPDVATANATHHSPTNWGFDAVRLAHNNNSSHESTFDEIRIGTSFADTISGSFAGPSEPTPEPEPYNAWVDEWFGSSGADPAVSGPLVDASGDGMLNLLVYALGGDPLASNIHRLPTLGEIDGHLTLTFDRVRPDITYLIEAGDDLIEFDVIATNPGQVGQVVVFVDPEPLAAHDRRFLRLRVVQPNP